MYTLKPCAVHKRTSCWSVLNVDKLEISQNVLCVLMKALCCSPINFKVKLEMCLRQLLPAKVLAALRVLKQSQAKYGAADGQIKSTRIVFSQSSYAQMIPEF